MIRAVIIEDEPKGRDNLRLMLKEHCSSVEVVAEAGSIAEAREIFDEPGFSLDVAFCDIDLPDGLVFEFLDDQRPIDFEVIFITAFDQFARDACDYASIGYLTKPIDPVQLEERVARIFPRQHRRMQERLNTFNEVRNNPNSFEKIAVSSVDGVDFIEFKELVRLEASDNYTHFVLTDGRKLIAAKTIKSYEKMLEPLHFFRTHKKHIININHMKRYVKADGGYALMTNNEQIDVSRRRKPEFMQWLRMRGLGM